jgi:hypothetical protein
MDAISWLPYAWQDTDPDGTPISICPTCGERCPATTDRYGERITDTYPAHYREAHPAQLAQLNAREAERTRNAQRRRREAARGTLN